MLNKRDIDFECEINLEITLVSEQSPSCELMEAGNPVEAKVGYNVIKDCKYKIKAYNA